MDDPRVLVCGSRRWPWPDTVTAVLDRLAVRYGERLVVIEGAATGADRAAHRWCELHQLPTWRHCCYPVAWNAERRRRLRSWQWSGPERNQRMLLAEEPRLVIAFHEEFDPEKGGTSDTCLRALLLGIPVWLTPGPDPGLGLWLSSDQFPEHRATQLQHQSGMPAVRHRSGSSVHDRGTYSARSMAACPRAAEYTSIDGDLGIFDAASRAGVLALDTDGRRALLKVARLVDHEHGLRVVQVVDDVGAYVVANRIGVPFRAVKQVLHAIGSCVACVLG